MFSGIGFGSSWRSTLLAGLVLAMVSGASSAQLDFEEPVTPAIDGVTAGGVVIRLIKDGFSGTEGPLGLPDGSLLFTETQANRITRIAPDDKVSVYLANSNGANGLALSAGGELYAVQTLKPRVGILDPKDKLKTLAESYEGKPLLRPNDLVLDRKGGVYFTDPGANPKPGEAPPAAAVYYIRPDGQLLRIASDITRPNGITLSPDEKTLYVANTFGETVLAYAVADDGSISKRRDFARLAGWQKTDTGGSSGADGLAVDAQGRLYVASNAGIEVFSADGKALGIITLPKQPQNLAFAGADKKTLYVVGRGAAYRFAVLTPGVATRAK